MIEAVVAEKAEDGSSKFTEAEIRDLITLKKIHDWNPETVKKLLSGQVSPSTKKADQNI